MPLVSEHDVRRVASRGRRTLAVAPDAVITPQALEVADRLGLKVVRGEPEEPAAPGIDASRAIARTLLRRSPR